MAAGDQIAGIDAPIRNTAGNRCADFRPFQIELRIMQCGLGWGEDRFTAMGANMKTRPSVFEEALDMVRRLLAGEVVSSSRRFRIAEARLVPLHRGYDSLAGFG